MELEFIWRLAHQLDKDTFFEIYGLLENTIEVGRLGEFERDHFMGEGELL